MDSVIELRLVLPSKSYAPEIYAYDDYFKNIEEINCGIVNEDEAYQVECDFLLIMPGYVFFFENIKAKYLIYDFVTLSTGRFVKFKNFIKSKTMKKAHINLFLNEAVRDGYKYKGEYLIRDMGVNGNYKLTNEKVRNSVVYCGSVTSSRNIVEVIKSFINSDLTLYLIGDCDDAIKLDYVNYHNIKFLGRMTREELLLELPRYEYGLNYTPDISPFNVQTSTKCLEYAAAGLKIITNEYQWVKDFVASSGASVFYWNDFFGIKSHMLSDFDFCNPNISGMSWNEVIENSRLKDEILSIYHNEK